MTTDDEIFERTTRLRRLVADTVEGLTPEQWRAQTLCAGWDVRTLVAHLGQPMVVGFGRMVLTALRHRGDIDRAVDTTARRLARRPIPELIATIRTHAGDRISPPRIGPHGPFVDACVHLRDIARPLGLDADATLEDWVAVAAYLTSPGVAPSLVSSGRLEGLRLVATDAIWQHGAGTEVRGPIEALCLAVTGRVIACADLTGPGRDLLQQRLAPAPR